MSTLDIFEVIRYSHRDGGGTFVIVGHDESGYRFDFPRLKDGYFVGAPHGIENLPNAALTREVIEAFIASAPTLPSFVGLWRDPETNKWSIDNVFHFDNFDVALNIGHRNGQKAIWDIAWETEHYTEYARGL